MGRRNIATAVNESMLDILIADDHELARAGLRVVLEAQPDWRVCAEAADGPEAVWLAASLKPAVAILDVYMPGLSGIDAARQIRGVSPATEILVLTGFDSSDVRDGVLSSGARGYVLKSDGSAKLISAVRSLSEGLYSTPRSSDGRSSRARRQGRTTLTPREREIAQLLAEGKTNGSVGTILGISVKTVETHRGNIMKKLELESIVELVHYAVRNQLVSP